MKILVVGDLHGQMPSIPDEQFDAIIAPGDFCSDASKPYQFQALRMQLEGKEVYWYDLVGKIKARRMIMKSIADGRRVLERLNRVGVPVFVVPGNWDLTKDASAKWSFLRTDHWSALVSNLPNVYDLHHKKQDLEGYSFIGTGISSGPEVPSDKSRYTKREYERMVKQFENDKKSLSKLFSSTRKPVVFLSHNMPFGSELDVIRNKKSPRNGEHCGSLIARDIIKKHSPFLCIGGHMHENFGTQKMGKTQLLNAGFGSSVHSIVTMKKKNVMIKLFNNGKVVKRNH